MRNRYKVSVKLNMVYFVESENEELAVDTALEWFDEAEKEVHVELVEEHE